ncbi:MAG: ArsA-related P-loop ATPase [Myxococcota bacterium]
MVVGKGGVGRTLMASALAKRAADAGHRTLLLEVDAPDSAARQLRVKPAVDEPREVLNNLWLCRMTPSGALREYALLTLRFKTLYNLVFENRFVKYFLKSIPSLGEFTMLGKAWYHSTEVGPQGRPRFERIIIDAPATGHALTFFSLARLVADIAPPGVMADASTKMAELIEDHDKTCFHVVTLPEEMPVNEALELCEAGPSRLRMAPGIGVVNRLMSPLLSPQEVAWVRDARAPLLEPAFNAALRRTGREQRQRAYVERFATNSGLPWLAIPERPADKVGHLFVDDVGRALDAFSSGEVQSFYSEDAA